MRVELQAVAQVQMGYSFRTRLEVDAEGDVAVIQMKDIDEADLLHTEGLARIRMPELKGRHVVQAGDLLFRSRGITNSVALVTGELSKAVLAAPLLLIRPDAERIEPAYLHWFINHPSTQARLAMAAAGTAVKMIGKAAVEALEIVLPPLSEQAQIMEIAALSAREIELLESVKRRRSALSNHVLMQAANRAAPAIAPARVKVTVEHYE
ncbi:restriction endonuclease subunit S [Lysobacter enzymogenes]|uniref:restriction endonuclease subunit S n=1 Tax=Lysobacter enzymogenes TaxID=69 RepID=UPI00374943F7